MFQSKDTFPATQRCAEKKPRNAAGTQLAIPSPVRELSARSGLTWGWLDLSAESALAE
jgi:hypothetical protein